MPVLGKLEKNVLDTPAADLSPRPPCRHAEAAAAMAARTVALTNKPLAAPLRRALAGATYSAKHLLAF